VRTHASLLSIDGSHQSPSVVAALAFSWRAPTCSGKTHTLLNSGTAPADSGVVVRIIYALFAEIKVPPAVALRLRH
jgi:hypothetical protein